MIELAGGAVAKLFTLGLLLCLSTLSACFSPAESSKLDHVPLKDWASTSVESEYIKVSGSKYVRIPVIDNIHTIPYSSIQEAMVYFLLEQGTGLLSSQSDFQQRPNDIALVNFEYGVGLSEMAKIDDVRVGSEAPAHSGEPHPMAVDYIKVWRGSGAISSGTEYYFTCSIRFHITPASLAACRVIMDSIVSGTVWVQYGMAQPPSDTIPEDEKQKLEAFLEDVHAIDQSFGL
jgi:hypothetical protein